MRTFVKGTNIKVTEAMKSYAEERLQRLDRYTHFLREVTLVYSVQRAWHIAEVTTRFHDTVLRAEERSNDMYVSVDKAVEKLEQQLERLKTRMDRRRRAARDRGEVDETAEKVVALFGADEDLQGEGYESIEPLGDGRIVKVKTYSVKPMTTEEAILQMELVDHDFFVFVREETEVNVLYKRRDGDYGLLVPDTQ